MIWRFKSVEKEQTLHCYWSSACQTCTMKGQCTTGKYRHIKRWEHEDVLEAVQYRLAKKPEMMRLERQAVEHPFGTLKAWMGATNFLTKSLKNVSTEMKWSNWSGHPDKPHNGGNGGVHDQEDSTSVFR